MSTGRGAHLDTDGPGRRDRPGGAAPPLFHVVLVNPEIPNNTGSIGRTCVATGCSLHLVHPLGFSLSEKARRRAGLDYWPRLSVVEHASWSAYLAAHEPAWVFSARASRPWHEASMRAGDHLVFGRETAGLPAEVIDRYADRAVGLPMVPGERSLNLAAAACVAIYEGVRQLAALGVVRYMEGRLMIGRNPAEGSVSDGDRERASARRDNP